MFHFKANGIYYINLLVLSTGTFIRLAILDCPLTIPGLSWITSGSSLPGNDLADSTSNPVLFAASVTQLGTSDP